VIRIVKNENQLFRMLQFFLLIAVVGGFTTDPPTLVSATEMPVIVLNRTNHVAISGGISGSSIASTLTNLAKLNTPENGDITIFIASYGGSVTAGNSFIEQLRFLKMQGHTIVCLVEFAYSMAFAIMQHCDYRYVTPTTSVMQHQMAIPESSGGLWGSYQNMKSYMNYLEQIEIQMNKEAATRLGLANGEEFRNKIAHDWWLVGQNIIDNKAADRFARFGCDSDLSNNNHTVSLTIFIFQVTIVYSDCPTIIYPLEVTVSDINGTAVCIDDGKLQDGELQDSELQHEIFKIRNPRLNSPVYSY
jgi:ATP-dependent protease ClpP protease subunit